MVSDDASLLQGEQLGVSISYEAGWIAEGVAYRRTDPRVLRRGAIRDRDVSALVPATAY
jgi:hypothetical protein